MRFLPLLLALFVSFPLVACEREPRGAALRIPLAERLPDARVGGAGASEPHPRASARAGRFEQRPDSTVTFALPLPVGASLRGRAEALGGGMAHAPLHVSVALRSESAIDRVLLEETITPGARLLLDEDLSDLAGELVALDFVVGGTGGGAESAVGWEDLAVEGFERRIAAPPEDAPGMRGRYNVLMILLDALRADHVAPYGAPVEATPHLARLARQGVTFADARTTSSWTKPAVASLFTSKPPWEHGLEEPGQRLPEVHAYLPALLAAAGWRTVAISATPMVSSAFGLTRGFHRIHNLWLKDELAAIESPVERADWVWRQTIAPLVRTGVPFFVYVHELDPHSPFEPPEGYRIASRPDEAGPSALSRFRGIGAIRTHREDFSDAEIARLNELYRGEVAAMDAYVGRLLAHLDAIGHARDTLVIFLSDHGEEFDDHHSIGHAHTVHEELIRIPLLMRLAGVLPAGVRLDQPVDVLDVAPTVLDLLGVDAPPAVRGRSLLPLLAGGAIRDRASLASSDEPRSHGLVWGPWKLIRGPDGGHRLYDLEADPGEQRDLWRERPVVGEALRQMLSRRLRQEAAPPEVRSQVTQGLTPELHERLRELGYLR